MEGKIARNPIKEIQDPSNRLLIGDILEGDPEILIEVLYGGGKDGRGREENM